MMERELQKLYLAYGANTNKDAMSYRCSEAEFLGLSEIDGHQLVFRDACDVFPEKDKKVICALWAITEKDERSLDVFEGFPKYYIKKQILIPDGREAFFYAMSSYNKKYVAKPSKSYLEMVLEGYDQCGIDTIQIFEALYLTNQLSGTYPR